MGSRGYKADSERSRGTGYCAAGAPEYQAIGLRH